MLIVVGDPTHAVREQSKGLVDNPLSGEGGAQRAVGVEAGRDVFNDVEDALPVQFKEQLMLAGGTPASDREPVVGAEMLVPPQSVPP